MARYETSRLEIEKTGTLWQIKSYNKRWEKQNSEDIY
jgi:hypothetical protein